MSDRRYHEHRQRRMVRACAVMLLGSVAGLWAVGALFLNLHPATDADKRCLNKTIMEMGECLRGR